MGIVNWENGHTGQGALVEIPKGGKEENEYADKRIMARNARAH